MTKREKVIVSIMCLTIIYGAYEMLGVRRTRKAAPVVKTTPTADLKSFVAEVSQKIASDKMAEEYQYIIAKAGAPWPKDPFLQSVEPLKSSLVPKAPVSVAAGAERPPDFVYTGFLSLGKTKMAIVNGLEYTEGEALTTGRYYVKTIFPNRVIIARTDNSETIQLPIKEMDFELEN